jgi:hypothetical protein
VIDWTVAEWSADRDDWVHLTPDHVITDSCLRTPVPVTALVDALESDNAAQRALIARGNPELQEHTARERREERLTTVRENIFDLFEDRQIAMDALQRARIEACDDLATLKRWLLRAARIESAAELLG